MSRKVSDGFVIMIPATDDTVVNDVIEFGTHSVGVAQTAGLDTEDINVEIVGVHSFEATTSEAFAVGDIAKWDNGTDMCLIAGATTMGMVVVGKGAGVVGSIEVKIG